MALPQALRAQRRTVSSVLMLTLFALVAVLLTAAAADARTIRGTAKADRLKGTAKADRIFARAGNDRIYARGGGADRISCGPGYDRVQADRFDTVSRCESVRRQPRAKRGRFGDEASRHQHGTTSGHLPPTSSNVDVLAKLRLTPHEDDVSDVSATQAPNGKWYAYLGDWGAKCSTGGVHVVDISDPANPEKVRFINSSGSGYVTEGLQALHIDTESYSGDILLISNEWCAPRSNPKQNPGGISIWDINDPTAPKLLVEAFGDFDVHGNRANESHSAIAWDAGSKAYVAAIDNEELLDVDLFEITNPRSPKLLHETNLPGVNVDAWGNEKTSHDFDVLRFNDGTAPDPSWHLMVSDWDAGWIDVNVDNPASPQIVGDFDYAECEAFVTTACPPEGNAHQGEWNSDGTVFVGTDEDLSPFRVPINVTDGPLANQLFPGGEFGFTKQVASFPGGKVNGPTVFGGYGCPDDAAEVPAATTAFPTVGAGEERIIVFQRGPVGDPNHDQHAACFFSDKIRMGEEKGYDVVIVANHHVGSNAGEFPDSFACGGQGSPVLGTAAGLCVGHRFMHEAFGKTANYDVPYPEPAPLEPTPGDKGPRIDAASQFDGWGHPRLIDTSNPAAPTEVGQIAIPQTADPAFASGFGDVDVHEVEVPRGDPDEGGDNLDTDKLAYFAWYSGGLRVANITNPANPQEVGRHIDTGGNDHWGVALAEDGAGKRIILASDRDFGLYIYRYTGPMP
jgi:hypothetical protein